MMPMQRARIVRLLLIAGLAAIGACDPSDPCDPGFYEEHGACYPNPRSADAGDDDARVDEGDDDDGGAGEPEPTDPYEGFGDPCEEQSDCVDGLICGAPQLALCTQVNCLDDPSICPPDWICYDTMGMSPDPNVDSVCLDF